jgi:hypothetical protein
MSGDEFVVTLFAILAGPVLWALWLWRMSRIQLVRGKNGVITFIAATVAASALFILSVLRTLAAADVIDAPPYQFMYVMLGLAWLRGAQRLFPFLGVSPRDDVVERRNNAALPVLIGALAGVTFCYAGGNIGNGPGWWVVVFSAALATAALLASWALLAQFTSIADAVAIDRDPAAGTRLCFFLMSCGVVLGRGVAGDWISASRTVADFATMLPAIAALIVLAVIMERLATPTPERPHGSLFRLGVMPAMIYICIGVAAVWWKGWPA